MINLPQVVIGGGDGSLATTISLSIENGRSPGINRPGFLMDMIGKTIATIGAAWSCLLFALLLFDYVQDAFNGQANLLFAGWSLLDIALLSVPGIALVAIGIKLARIY